MFRWSIQGELIALGCNPAQVTTNIQEDIAGCLHNKSCTLAHVMPCPRLSPYNFRILYKLLQFLLTLFLTWCCTKFPADVNIQGANYMGKFQSGRPGWKKPWLHKTFQPGLKLKSEVYPGRNLSVAFVVLAICIFPRLSIIFRARVGIFRAITWDFSAQVAQTGLKLSSWNRELCFSSILPEGRAETSARLTELEFQPGLKLFM